MTQSDYTYEFAKMYGTRCIVITDLNQGNKSVTNDIENVVADIARKEQLNPTNFPIIYSDTEGIYNGWDAYRNKFVPLHQKLKMVAVEMMVHKFRFSNPVH